MLAELLNEHCQCVSSDRKRLRAALAERGLEERLADGKLDPAALFAEFPVFLEPSTLEPVERLVAAVHAVAKNARFQACALDASPESARIDQGTRGILHGFDFHLSPDGPRLIEINTNAGGALLNVALAAAQDPCCNAVRPFLVPASPVAEVEQALVSGFRSEYALARGPEAELRTVAIVDEAPESQFLFSEFVLFEKLLRSHGIDAMIAGPGELEHARGALWLRGKRVDLVYNRLTDFYLEGESVRALASAYAAGEVVLTPHPRAHALLANKRHLALFSNELELRELGVAEADIRTLIELVPPAEVVRPEARERLFRERKQLFFKPLAGYASKAAYRGDKLTRGKFEELFEQPYLAQKIVAPSERVVRVGSELQKLKLDLRAYVVGERVVLLAARLYQGQTTNFRTRGGGFATVLCAPSATPAGAA
jgi:hypothetical protein